MPRRVSLVVLCEDAQHLSFAAAFLSHANLPTRGSPRFVRCGNKANVQPKFAIESKALLGAGAETHLLVLIDADGKSHEKNEQYLMGGLDAQLRGRLKQNGRYLIVCPNWEIENWIESLAGRAQTEDRDRGSRQEQSSACKPVARKLADDCRENNPLQTALPSLIDACARWRAYLKGHKF